MQATFVPINGGAFLISPETERDCDVCDYLIGYGLAYPTDPDTDLPLERADCLMQCSPWGANIGSLLGVLCSTEAADTTAHLFYTEVETHKELLAAMNAHLDTELAQQG